MHTSEAQIYRYPTSPNKQVDPQQSSPLENVAANEQQADILTKPLPGPVIHQTYYN